MQNAVRAGYLAIIPGRQVLVAKKAIATSYKEWLHDNKKERKEKIMA